MDKPTSKLIDLRTSNKFSLGDILSVRLVAVSNVPKHIKVVFSNGYELIVPTNLYDKLTDWILIHNADEFLTKSAEFRTRLVETIEKLERQISSKKKVIC